MTILGNIYLSSQVLNFHDVVVAIGKYYYSEKTKGIEKRSSKRKRGDTTISHPSTNRIIEWKAGPDPKENAIQIASALHAFAGENVMSVYHLATALDTTQVRIVEFENTMNTQKDDIIVEFEKVEKIAENLHNEETEKAL